jgi:hypothetical protein
MLKQLNPSNVEV